MPEVTPTVWTMRRKWLGNLIPALFWLPLILFGIFWMTRTGEVVGWGLWSLIAATVLGWIAVNFFGLFENNKMRRQLELMLKSRREDLTGAVFVGMATPKFSSMLDPHEDVGFLRIYPDRLSFVSETRTVDLFHGQVQRVRFRPNVHSILGLGRWISIEGELDHQPIRLLIEPREKPNLLSNRNYSKALAKQIKDWAAQPSR